VRENIWRSKMITQGEYDLILQKCREIPSARGTYLIHDYIENLLLTVLDFQMHNVAVEKAIAYYRNNRSNETRTLDDLKYLLSRYANNQEGNTAAAQYLWGNNHWTRVSLLRKLVAYFDSIGVTSQEALRRWAAISNFQEDFKGKIPGMGYAIYQWLVMRQGVETVKPDVHLISFVRSIVHHSFTDSELVTVLEKVAKGLKLKAYELDWKIWEYERNRETPIELTLSED
jgi:hypothetical protein